MIRMMAITFQRLLMLVCSNVPEARPVVVGSGEEGLESMNDRPVRSQESRVKSQDRWQDPRVSRHKDVRGKLGGLALE